MNTPTQAPSSAAGSDEFEAIVALAVAIIVGPFAIVLGAVVAELLDGRRRLWAWLLAIPSLVSGLVVWPVMRRHLLASATAVHAAHAHGNPGRILAAVWPHLWPAWAAATAFAPLVTAVIVFRRGEPAPHLGRGRNPDDGARDVRLERRSARRALRDPEQHRTAERSGVFLGYKLGGDDLLPTRRGRVAMPLSRLSHHLIVAGATGSGKTETVLRLSYSLAAISDWTIVYIDGKGDHHTQERFTALMRHAGRNVDVFPDERYDGWRGTSEEIANRLLQLIDFAEEGGGTYYRDLAVQAIHLACRTPVGPPQSSTELLRRLHTGALAELHAGRPDAGHASSFRREDLDSIRTRYAAFFTTVGDSLDGTLSFDQIDTGYFLLDGLRLKQEAGRLARFLVEEFTQWAVGRKPRNQQVLLIVDEFSAIAQAGQGLVDVVERARGFGVAAVLCPQVADGMGGIEAAARIIGSAQTILLHATALPSALVDVAGTRRVYEYSHQVQGDAATGLGSARIQHAYRVDLDELRRLETGQCFAISRGRAMKLQIAPAPSLASLNDLQADADQA